LQPIVDEYEPWINAPELKRAEDIIRSSGLLLALEGISISSIDRHICYNIIIRLAREQDFTVAVLELSTAKAASTLHTNAFAIMSFWF